MQYATFHGTLACRIQISKLGSSNSLSLGENKRVNGRRGIKCKINKFLLRFLKQYTESLYLKDFLFCKILLW